ncbi:MAG: hypothetical protein KKB36_13785, partial [Gammaproteobacteria bacterium]|nr:hypothetical protein [Gammaproteobacteria bacterium]
VVSHQLYGLLVRPILGKNRVAQKICQMVKKSPSTDKVITHTEQAQPLTNQAIRGCGMMPQSK